LDVLPSVSEVWSFHTLTLPAWVRGSKELSPEDRTLASLSLIRANWDKLMKRLKRQVGAVQYFRVFEKHGDGVIHVHFLISHWIPQDELHQVKSKKKKPDGTPVLEYWYWRWLKDNAPACGFGYMTSSENLLDPKAGVGYTTKYMTKEDGFLSDMLTKYRVRRFQSSQGIGSQDKWGKSEDEWEIGSFVMGYEMNEIKHHDLNLKKDITKAMRGTSGEYPPIEEYHKSEAERKSRKAKD